MAIWMTEDDFRAIALSDGVREVCLGDAWERFRDYSGSVREFLKEVRPDALHWWAAPASDTPGNAALFSIQAQGEYVKAHGEAAARSMLAAEGLKLGQIKSAPKPDHSGSNNPYALGGDPAKRQERIVGLLKGNARLAANLAKVAGCRIDGTPISKN